MEGHSPQAVGECWRVSLEKNKTDAVIKTYSAVGIGSLGVVQRKGRNTREERIGHSGPRLGIATQYCSHSTASVACSRGVTCPARRALRMER